MKRRDYLLLSGVLALIVGAATLGAALRPPSVPGVHAQDAVAPDPDDKPLHLKIWYPETPRRTARLPLVVISHGTGGSATGHGDTAAALARAGFVVAAMDHTGDNYRDSSHVRRGLHLGGRPRHVSRAIDYILHRWPRRALVDPARIGMFGHSAGGFTALVVAGAEPDLRRGGVFCRERPESWTCRYLQRNGYTLADLGRQRRLRWHHDPRVRAIAIAAPAIGYSFDPAALAHVRVPVQLWAAGQDSIVEDSPAAIRAALPLRPEYLAVANAGHFSFLAPCSVSMKALIWTMHWFGIEKICTDPDGFDRGRFHARFNRSLVAFFKANLR